MDYTHRGAYTTITNYGSAATIEWDEPLTPCAYPNSFSTAWVMSGKPSAYIQGGWFKKETNHTEIFMEWDRGTSEPFDRKFYGLYTNDDWRFVVFRNYSFPDNTWTLDIVRLSDNQHFNVYNVGNIPTPMDRTLVYSETPNTYPRMWGKISDRAAFYSFAYRASDRGYYATSLTCAGNPEGNQVHYHVSCNTGDVVNSFATWDDRRP
jgi:hypothetical protein